MLNKVDRLDEFTRSRLRSEYPDAVFISAHTREGFDEFTTRLDALLAGDERLYRIPADRQELIAFAHREGSVIDIAYEDAFVILRARTAGRLQATLEPFLAEGDRS